MRTDAGGPALPLPPRESSRDTEEGIIISVDYDWCVMPDGSVIPFTIWAKQSDDANTTTSVRHNGKRTHTSNSLITTCYGDEPAEAGIFSGTTQGICWPATWSPTVRNEGGYAVRHSDYWRMNNGNCKGKLFFIKETSQHPLLQEAKASTGNMDDSDPPKRDNQGTQMAQALPRPAAQPVPAPPIRTNDNIAPAVTNPITGPRIGPAVGGGMDTNNASFFQNYREYLPGSGTWITDLPGPLGRVDHDTGDLYRLKGGFHETSDQIDQRYRDYLESQRLEKEADKRREKERAEKPDNLFIEQVDAQTGTVRVTGSGKKKDPCDELCEIACNCLKDRGKAATYTKCVSDELRRRYYDTDGKKMADGTPRYLKDGAQDGPRTEASYRVNPDTGKYELVKSNNATGAAEGSPSNAFAITGAPRPDVSWWQDGSLSKIFELKFPKDTETQMQASGAYDRIAEHHGLDPENDVVKINVKEDCECGEDGGKVKLGVKGC